MITVLLTVLKIIGIIMLSIVGLLLLIVILLLAVPVRYRGNASRYEEIKGSVFISWLLKLLQVRITYDKELKIRVCVLGLTVYRNYDNEEKTGKDKQNLAEGKSDSIYAYEDDEIYELNVTDEESAADGKNTLSEEAKPVEKIETTEINKPELNDNSETVVSVEKTDASEEKDSQEYDSQESSKKEDDKKESNKTEDDKKKSSKEEGDKKKRNNDHVADNEEADTGKNKVARKFKSLYNKYEQIKACIDDERVKKAFSLIMKKLGAVLKAVLPRRIEGELKFGFEEPQTTGYVLAVLSAFYGVYAERFTIMPDFEQKLLKGKISFKGRICFGRLAFIALRILLSSDCRYAYKLIKTTKENL